jgi:hypothetical protein
MTPRVVLAPRSGPIGTDRGARTRERRVVDELGQVGGLEAIVFGLLVFVVGTLVIVNAWGVIDAKLAAGAAAREAVRAYVEAPSASDASGAARQAAADSLAGQGRQPARMDLRVVAGDFSRCSRVTMEVRYPVPLIVLPWIGRAGHGFTVAARHSEVVDPYRRGLPGSASCAAA